jgi:hypothetical protein
MGSTAGVCLGIIDDQKKKKKKKTCTRPANAPVVKAVFLTSGALTLCAHLLHVHPWRFALSSADVAHWRLWKPAVSLFVYSSPASLFLGSLALYWARILERQRGSRRFAATCAAAVAVALAAEWAVLAFCCVQGGSRMIILFVLFCFCFLS